MQLKKKIIQWILADTGILFVLLACQSVPKAELISLTPDQAIEEVTAIQGQAQFDQVDLLASADYKKGLNKFAKLKDKSRSVEDRLESASTAKAYFLKSIDIAKSRAEYSPPILQARKVAVMGGAHASQALRADLAKIDERLRDRSDEFSHELNLDDFTNLQKSYLNLEVDAIVFEQLDLAKKAIGKAESADAKKRAPKTLVRAKIDVATAQNLIMQDAHDSREYSSSVKKANQSAFFLSDVMGKMAEMGDSTSERMAVSLVLNDREIGDLTSDLKDTVLSLDSSMGENSALLVKYDDQKEQLQTESRKVDFQRALEKARGSFAEEEVDAYQQGDQLVIRLKTMDFPSGSNKIPKKSKDTLSKIDEIIKGLNSGKILVQGHADSVGGREFNKKLSAERARKVAAYMRSKEPDLNIGTIGLGETKPIATNSTKAGRATNRRVDIIISAQ
jgi:OOP family OmpA-OmpF porin